MARALTKKQRGFVKDYVATGNGTQAALKNYDTEDYKTASVISAENLEKPSIVNALEEALKDEDLAEKHKQLLNATRLDHMVFPINNPTDEEITELLAGVNCTVRKIVHGETARHVYFWSVDNKARKDALDMAYKIKGTYAPEKKAVLTATLDAGDVDVLALATKAAELLKEQKIHG